MSQRYRIGREKPNGKRRRQSRCNEVKRKATKRRDLNEDHATIGRSLRLHWRACVPRFSSETSFSSRLFALARVCSVFLISFRLFNVCRDRFDRNLGTECAHTRPDADTSTDGPSVARQLAMKSKTIITMSRSKAVQCNITVIIVFLCFSLPLLLRLLLISFAICHSDSSLLSFFCFSPRLGSLSGRRFRFLGGAALRNVMLAVT